MWQRHFSILLVLYCILIGEMFNGDTRPIRETWLSSGPLVAKAIDAVQPVSFEQSSKFQDSDFYNEAGKQTRREFFRLAPPQLIFISQIVDCSSESLRGYFSRSRSHLAPLQLCAHARHERTGVFLS